MSRRKVHALGEAPRARSRVRRWIRLAERCDDRGLTSLEWLLIVAAVAGLAALAVVLVQNVVDDTSDEISSSSARMTAADLAVAVITADAQAPGANAHMVAAAESKCERVSIGYSEVLGGANKRPQWYKANILAAMASSGVTKEQDARNNKLPIIDGRQQLTGIAANTCLIVDQASPAPNP